MSSPERAAPSSVSPEHLKHDALVSVLEFLIRQASEEQSTASLPLPGPSLSLLSSLQRRVDNAELYYMDMPELETAVSAIIEHRLVSVYSLNALSLVHFLRVAQRREGDDWSTPLAAEPAAD